MIILFFLLSAIFGLFGYVLLTTAESAMQETTAAIFILTSAVMLGTSGVVSVLKGIEESVDEILRNSLPESDRVDVNLKAKQCVQCKKNIEIGATQCSFCNAAQA